jgi:peptide-methionine (R)-S-oxide reductase
MEPRTTARPFRFLRAWLPALALAWASGCGADVAPSPPPPPAAVGRGQEAARPAQPEQEPNTMSQQPTATDRMQLSDEEWRRRLTAEQYRVLRKEGTERAFSGKYWDEKTPGVYACAACGQALFSSKTKFDSGTGWPSFYDPIDEKSIGIRIDRSLFMTREEVHCERCGGHLGHVFDDGPPPTGKRYCINSVSLELRSGEDASANQAPAPPPERRP